MWELAKAFYDDFDGMLELLKEAIGKDFTRLTDCSHYDTGKVIGEYLSPAVLLKLATKLPKLTKLGELAKKLCSFRGDMLVATSLGFIAIENLEAGIHEVLARDEATGRQEYKTVLDQYSNPYDETVYVEVSDTDGQTQTIVSNRVHPFYVEGIWKQADELISGDQLSTQANGTLAVKSIEITQEPLKAYNLHVEQFNTYFVKAPDASDAVWVHNVCPDNWNPYNNKHKPRKNIKWKDVVTGTKNGPAKYHHDVNIKDLETGVANNGIKINHPAGESRNWIIMDHGKIIGAKNGKETSYSRVEIAPDGSYHGHPITKQEYDNLKQYEG